VCVCVSECVCMSGVCMSGVCVSVCVCESGVNVMCKCECVRVV